MNMQRITLSELSEPVRLFLSQVHAGQGIVVEDDTGRSQYGIIPYTEATPEEKKAAWQQLQRVQDKVGAAMTQAGVIEADVEDALLEDD